MRTEKTARGRGKGWETLSFSSSLFFSRSLTSRRTSLPPSEIQEPRKETLSKLIWLSFRGEREEGEGPIVLKEHKQKKEKLFAFDNVQTFGVLVVVSIKEKNCVYILLKACFVKTIFFFFVLRKNLVLRASRLSLWQRNRRKWSSLTPAAVILENERALRKGLRTAVVRVYTEKKKWEEKKMKEKFESSKKKLSLPGGAKKTCYKYLRNKEQNQSTVIKTTVRNQRYPA